VRPDGLLIETCGPRDDVVKVLPPLTTPEDQLREGLGIVAEATLDPLVVPA
jgi:diaminobutyrate-2-oxoglutarate transaminase